MKGSLKFIRRKTLFVAALLSLFMLVAPNLSATVMKYLGVADLVEASDVVVVAKVQKKEFTTDKNGDLVTNVTVVPSRTLLGEEAKTLTFQQWGGETELKQSKVPGDARFEVGEEAVLFLRKADMEPGLFLTALGQSKYQISRGDGGATATRELDDISFLRDGGGPTKIEHLPSEVVKLDTLLSQIETVAKAKKEAK